MFLASKVCDLVTLLVDDGLSMEASVDEPIKKSSENIMLVARKFLNFDRCFLDYEEKVI